MLITKQLSRKPQQIVHEPKTPAPYQVEKYLKDLLQNKINVQITTKRLCKGLKYPSFYEFILFRTSLTERKQSL